MHSSTLESAGSLDGATVEVAGLVGFLDVDEAGSVVEVGEVGAVGEVEVLAEVVALCWSEGLLPSDVLPDPHAAVVKNAATTPAPSAYVLQLPGRTFTEVPLFSRGGEFSWMDASR